MTSKKVDWYSKKYVIKAGPGSWDTIISTFENAVNGHTFNSTWGGSFVTFQLKDSELVGYNEFDPRKEPLTIGRLVVMINQVGKMTLTEEPPHARAFRDRALILWGKIIDGYGYKTETRLCLYHKMPRNFCAAYKLRPNKNKIRGLLWLVPSDWRDEFMETIVKGGF